MNSLPNEFRDKRLNVHAAIAAELIGLSDERLSALINDAPPFHSGIGGESVLISINGASVFVKKLPLSDLERQPTHHLSTANIFTLPLYYQYGIGSSGFGAWRELAANVMTTDWVLTDECPHFPILHHWRVLPAATPLTMTHEHRETIERDVAYWESSPAVRNRLEAIHGASAHLVMFFECIKQDLYTWLRTELESGEEHGSRAVTLIEQNLSFTNAFMKQRAFIHFDAHFKNILTDGKMLYFSDLGLALSSQFELGDEDVEFFEHHRNYDQCTAALSLVHGIVTGILGPEHWTDTIAGGERLSELQNQVAPTIRVVLERHTPAALVMNRFFKKLQYETKRTPFPDAQLNDLLV